MLQLDQAPTRCHAFNLVLQLAAPLPAGWEQELTSVLAVGRGTLLTLPCRIR